MKFWKMRRTARLFVLVLLALTLMLGALPAGAEESCAHAEGYENGFCIGCGSYQVAPLNEGVYEISNAGQLYYVADLMRVKGNTNLYAKLMCNITVNADLLDDSGEPRTGNKREWTPIGIESAPVKNVSFDGQGYYISGLYAKYEDGRDVGFFGYVSAGEDLGIVVKNLGIIDSYFHSDNGFVGGIIGYSENNTWIRRCYVDATLKSDNSMVGGFAGALDNMTIPSGVTDSYTTYSKVGNGGNFLNCYYFSDSAADDGVAGTEYYTSSLLLADGETTLLAALSTPENPWVINCRTKMPALRIEHIYQYQCSIECLTCHDTGRTDNVPHAYEHDCDRYCEVCNTLNPSPVEHEGFTTCGTVCRKCGITIPALTGHLYSDACDTTCDCGFEREVPGHQYRNACDTHCDLCDGLREAVPHVYENGCDQTCNECGTTRAPQHTYDSVCDAECNVCKKTREAGHVFGEYVVTKEAGTFSNGEQERTCTLCGHKEITVIPRSGMETWAVVLIGVGVGLVLSVGGFALYWFLFKKRTLAEFFKK